VTLVVALVQLPFYDMLPVSIHVIALAAAVALLAGALVAARQALELESLPVVFAVGACGVLAYWVACYRLWFEDDERELVRGLLRRGR
jgi:hypothetical protein